MGATYLRYIKDKGAIVHIWDYRRDRQDHALCGHGYENPTELNERRTTPKRLCSNCRVLAPVAEAISSSQDAEVNAQYARELEVEYERLWREYSALWVDYEWWVRHSDNQREEIANLHRTWRPKKWDDRSPPPPRKLSQGAGPISPGGRPPDGRPRVTL
jgi:hypothetical protein